jgi:cytochrome P450
LNPIAWINPFKVDPERFLDTAEVKAKGIYWIGFSKGRHPCMGTKISLSIATMVCKHLNSICQNSQAFKLN